MKPSFKIFLFTLFIMVGSFENTTAQDAYGRSIGLRGGTPTGVSYKHFLEFAGAIEGIVGYNFTNGRIFTVTGLYEQHFFLNYNLNFYAGGGLTLGVNSDEFRLIVDAIGGIEYVFPRFPMSFSLDYKPAFHIFGPEFLFNEFALTIRYILD
jgi:hypothetical protein